MPELVEQRTGRRLAPDLGERCLQHIADRMVAPELVGVDGSVPRNAPDPFARRVSAVERQQLQRPVGVGMFLRLHPQIEGDAVARIVHREHLHGEPSVKAGLRLGDDRLKRGAGLDMVKIRGSNLLASAGIDKMVEANARNPFGTHQVEDGGDGAYIVTRHRHAQSHFDVSVAEAANGGQRTTIGAGLAAECVVDGFGAVDGDSYVGDAQVADPIRPEIVDERAVCRERHAQALLLGMRRKRADVWPGERFAAGEEDHGHAEVRKVVYHGTRLFRGQHLLFAGRSGIAVRAGEVAGGRTVPYHHGTPMRARAIAQAVGGLDRAAIKF